jgi:hypothetical protein
MPLLFVARSAELSKWASDVGLGKNIFKVGIAPDKDALTELVNAGWAGVADWRLVLSCDAEELSEEEAFERLDSREKVVDPNLYPRIKSTPGIVRIPQSNVLNAMLVAQAMASADQPLTAPKPKPKDYAEYLFRSILK